MGEKGEGRKTAIAVKEGNAQDKLGLKKKKEVQGSKGTSRNKQQTVKEMIDGICNKKKKEKAMWCFSFSIEIKKKGGEEPSVGVEIIMMFCCQGSWGGERKSLGETIHSDGSFE